MTNPVVFNYQPSFNPVDKMVVHATATNIDKLKKLVERK